MSTMEALNAATEPRLSQTAAGDVPSIRSLHDEDLPAIVAIENQELPPERHTTVADLRRDFAPASDRVALRLVAGDPAASFLEVVDYPNIPRDKVRCSLCLIVERRHRRRGIGGLLYQHALAFAQERQTAMLQCRFNAATASESEPPAVFLRYRGFAEVEYERRQTSHLDLSTFDAACFAGAIARVEAQGIRILACADLPDTVEHRRRLFDLFVAAEMVPRRTSFETWGIEPNRWEWARQSLVVAEADGIWVGFTQVAPHNLQAGVWRTRHAATLPEYRNRGIGTALKLRSIELLRARGCRIMLTANRLNNAPILAINRKLGYIPGPLELTYVKVLREPQGTSTG
ncbi:MAG: GNAT family N-acetyltransferase [Chloroflexi bacterium]|nr:GNAT family N-acetyltransferase [Chloroflexota bacterium]